MKYTPHDYQTRATNFILEHPKAGMLLRIGGWKSGSKLEKVPGYGPQRCYHRSTGND